VIKGEAVFDGDGVTERDRVIDPVCVEMLEGVPVKVVVRLRVLDMEEVPVLDSVDVFEGVEEEVWVMERVLIAEPVTLGVWVIVLDPV
jgi:hypothetical protein